MKHEVSYLSPSIGYESFSPIPLSQKSESTVDFLLIYRIRLFQLVLEFLENSRDDVFSAFRFVRINISTSFEVEPDFIVKYGLESLPPIAGIIAWTLMTAQAIYTVAPLIDGLNLWR